MSKLLHSYRLPSFTRRSFSPAILTPKSYALPLHTRSLFPLHIRLALSDSQFFAANRRTSFLIRAFDSSPESETEKGEEKVSREDEKGKLEAKIGNATEDYPSGDFVFEEVDWWRSFLVKCRMLIAYPWQRVRKGSVLSMRLRGQISDQLKSRFSSGLSLPQICENFVKAAYDPRISGIYLQIEPLDCGWGKVEEIRRHILDYKKSGINYKLQQLHHSVAVTYKAVAKYN